MSDEKANDDSTPPQAAEAADTSAVEAEADAGETAADDDLSSKSISQLKAIASSKGVDISNCIEKKDIVDRVAAAPDAPAAAAAAPAPAPGANEHAFNFNLGAAAAAADSDDDDDNEDGEDPEDMMQILPPCIIRRVEHLRELNTQREAIVEEYQAERAALERKFATKYQPLFEKRAEVIAGKFDKEIDVEAAKKDKKEGKEEAKEEAEEEEIVGIPQFWVCAMGHMEAIAELITERDVDCLEALTDVRCVDDEDGGGFSLEFYFRENEYFTNKVLRKKYTIPNLMLDDEPILKNVEGCDIDWKAGICLTHREVKKKQRAKSGKNAGQIRTIIKKEKAESFFHFFSPPKIPTMDEMDEEEADAIEQAFDVDYDVAQAFRSHIIPKAALWFTGEALDEGFEIAEGEWPGDEEDGDGEESGAGEAAAAAAMSSPFPPPADGEENPECKQN